MKYDKTCRNYTIDYRHVWNFDKCLITDDANSYKPDYCSISRSGETKQALAPTSFRKINLQQPSGKIQEESCQVNRKSPFCNFVFKEKRIIMGSENTTILKIFSIFPTVTGISAQKTSGLQVSGKDLTKITFHAKIGINRIKQF